MFETKATEEIAAILTHGGSVEINVGPRRTEEIVQLAIAANTGGSRLFLKGLIRRQDELVQIAIAGRGAVTFSD